MAVMEPKHNLILILLSKLTGKESATEIYDKTRFAWRTKLERAQTVDYVIAHDSDENVLGVFKPVSWLKGDDPAFESLNRGSHESRIGFVGEAAAAEIVAEYSAFTTPPRKKGAANPIRYLSPVDQAREEAVDENEDDGVARRTYLAGVAVDDEGEEAALLAAYDFVDAAYYKFSQASPIYLVGLEREPESHFTLEAKDYKLIKLFEGACSDDDPEPSKEEIANILGKHRDLTILDENYMFLWFAFDYPDEDEDAFDDPGDNWRYDFQQLANLLEGFTLVGYNSEIEDVIWQQWDGGDFDEGAISNPDTLDHYSGENVQTQHFVAMETFDLLK
jgi:hypothetical protein